jgi:N-acetylornithine carbamoyltransferase
MKEFCDLSDLKTDEIEELLKLANELERHPQPRALEGKVLALLFLNPSLRTLTSFQASMTRLGGGTFVVSPEMSIHGLETRSGIVMDGTAAEHIREAVPVIASYADVIGIRALASRENLATDLADLAFNELRSLCDIPLINLESAIKHPCQSLADWKTLNDLDIPEKGGKLVFSWVYHPEALPLAVPADTIYMAAKRGMEVTVLRPDEFALPASIIARAKKAAAVSGGCVTETSDCSKAMEAAHVLYVGSWASTVNYGNKMADQKVRSNHENWCIDENWFKPALKSCMFMHCLPVRRGVEVEDEILDGTRSVVVKQARNRMYVQMSVLHKLLAGQIL